MTTVPGGIPVASISIPTGVFLLMVPTVSESLRSLPVGHPLVTDLKDPLLLGAQGTLFLALIVGIPWQMRALARRNAILSQANG